MDNKIIFLGTAGESSVIGKQYRASGGIVLQLGEIQLHIDPGPGSLVRADQYGVNLRANTGLLVSNSNLKNCNDLNIVVDAMTHSGLDKKGVLVVNKTVVNGDENSSSYLTKMHRNYVEKIIVMEKGKKIGIEDLEIHALPAKTEDANAVGYKIISPYSTIIYSGDTGFSKELAKNYETCDILILNVDSPESSKSNTSLSSEDAIKIISDVKPVLAIITGFGIKMLKSDPLYEARRIQKETGVQVVAAKDGMVISANSFSSRVRQKTLKAFSPAQSSSAANVREIEESNELELSEPAGEPQQELQAEPEQAYEAEEQTNIPADEEFNDAESADDEDESVKNEEEE